jgi:hypothetical protein
VTVRLRVEIEVVVKEVVYVAVLALVPPLRPTAKAPIPYPVVKLAAATRTATAMAETVLKFPDWLVVGIIERRVTWIESRKCDQLPLA